jgi:[acyl-carrier-protein] S-malonyltransferase
MKTALVVAPGRGTYNAAELGWLSRFHGARPSRPHAGETPALQFIAMADAYRIAEDQASLTALDSAPAWKASLHGRGDNASPLIFACSWLDFLDIDRTAFEVVAVTGNSMGWYTALACAGALDPAPALGLVNTMGRLMEEASVGGQAIWTLVDEDWRAIPGRREELAALIADIHGRDGAELYVSIALGGMLVLAGNDAGLAAMTARAPKGPGRFPLGLPGHAGFHSAMQAPVSARARQLIDPAGFQQPKVPLIDGAGRIWRPRASDLAALWDYTLGEQVVTPYDFTRALGVAVREFAPEAVIVLGPGETLGGAVAQSLIAAGWRGLKSKTDFQAQQAADPFVLAMGRADQRRPVVGG